ncbi:MAG: DUF2235 domain-containing protein [Candidatus Scalinduaceae bacterium]
MVRNIVLCSDGTGSKGIQKRGTNVFKLYEAVDLHGHRNDSGRPQQFAFYDDGVGTENLKLLKILGGAFGWGLSKNVKQLYADLVRTYEKGDRIYLFGFSRGAFTVRTLAGLINTCGIIDREKLNSDAELLDKVEMAYSKYRSKYRTFIGKCFREEYNEEWIVDFRNEHSVGDEKIAFIGVWDTVDAVGVPIDELAKFINTFIYRFKFVDSKLSSEEKVKKLCHALSIDDERLTFHPVMWDEEGEEDKEDKKDSRIEQVWFAGVHSNVGGGYPKHGMSLISLDWMMSKAEQAGLRLTAKESKAEKAEPRLTTKDMLRFIDHDRELYRDRRNVTDKLYDSRSGMAVYYRYKPRDIGGDKFCQEYHIITPKIHNSVIERILQCTEGYAPGNIPFNCEFVSTDKNDKNYDQDKNYKKKYDLFIQIFRKHLNGDNSLLDRVKRWVSIRRYSHYAFLFTSIIAFSIILSAKISDSNITEALKMLFSVSDLIKFIGKDLLFTKQWIWILLIPILLVVFYVIGRWARKRMNRVFSEFWYMILKEVEKTKKDSGSLDKTIGTSD